MLCSWRREISILKYINSPRLETVQRFLKRYVKVNEMIGNTSDEYAIITLSDKATWVK